MADKQGPAKRERPRQRMRPVQYSDPDGRIFVTTIPEDAPDNHASMGVPVGPPDLSELELPDDWAIRVQNALVERGILTWDDFRRNRMIVVGALNHVLREQISRLEEIYRDA